MAIPNREALRNKLDSLGVSKVKRRLKIGAYSSNKVPIVETWLSEQKELLPVEVTAEKSKTRADRYMEGLKNHPVVAVVVVAAVILTGTAQLTDSIVKIAAAFVSVFHPSVPLPIIPGESGWLLLGDLDPSGKEYVRGPLYVVEKSNYKGKALIPRKGEQVRLSAERNVIIPGYKVTGFANQLMAPWSLNTLSDADYTGVKLPKGAVVEIRDISLGSYPNQPIVVWVRVAAPPK
jgi:hypothetical protein